MLQTPKYKTDQCTLKVYGTPGRRRIKLTHMNVLRQAGVPDEQPKAKKGEVNEEKLDENIRRAKAAIYELADCNPWEFFCTLTIDPNKYARNDLKAYHKAFSQFLRDTAKRCKTRIQYLFVPELHADGKSWHMHGFIRGLPETELRQFRKGDKMGSVIAQRVLSGVPVFNWPAYQGRFGFCDLEPIQDIDRASKYIQKYLTKDTSRTVSELGAHMFYASQGLQRAEEIARGTFPVPPEMVPAYENEHCAVYWFSYTPDTLQQLASAFASTQDNITKFGKAQELRLLETDSAGCPFDE